MYPLTVKVAGTGEAEAARGYPELMSDELPPMPDHVDVYATTRNHIPVAALHAVDVVGDARDLHLTIPVVMSLMRQLAQFLDDTIVGPSPEEAPEQGKIL